MFSRTSALALLLIFPQLAPAADAPGKVELSLSQWQETMARLTKAETPLPAIEKPVAPCPAIISSERCEVSWQNGQWRLTTDFEVEVLQDRWLILPLADAGLPLLSSQVSEGRIITKDGACALLTNKPGPVKIRLVQETPQPIEDLDFWVSSATSIQAHLTSTEPGLHLTLNEAALTSAPLAVAPAEKERTPLQFRRTTVPAVEKKDLTPGVWESRSETQIAYEDGRLNYHHRVVLLCTSGNDSAATLLLPPDCIVLRVASEELDRWEATAAQDHIALQLDWKKPGARQRILFVDVARSQPNIMANWPLNSPQTGQPQPEVWQLTIPSGLRTTVPAEHPLAASLSTWMQEKLTGNDAPVFQALAGVNIPVTPLKTIALAEARIEAARFSSELAAGGGMLSDATLEIAATEKTTVDLQFEKDTRIISCRVAGQRQNPLDLGDGRIQLSLPAARDRISVELTFSQQLVAFDPASGQVRLTMPQTPLLTKTASWRVRLPDGLSLSAFDGSVVADASGASGELHFQQELYRDTAPLAILFYQKKIK